MGKAFQDACAVYERESEKKIIAFMRARGGDGQIDFITKSEQLPQPHEPKVFITMAVRGRSASSNQ